VKARRYIAPFFSLAPPVGKRKDYSYNNFIQVENELCTNWWEKPVFLTKVEKMFPEEG
jgi:hypothetical protein